MKVMQGFEEAMQEMIDYVRYQDLNVKQQFQQELEAVNEFLEDVLVSFEQDDFSAVYKPTKNQERKEFIEEAKRYWKEKGKGFFLAQELVNGELVWRIGFKPDSDELTWATLGNRDTAPDIPKKYQTNIHLMKAFLLSESMNDGKYSEQTQIPLPTHFAKNMRIGRDKSSAFDNTKDILIRESAGKPFQKHFVLLDDTDVVYE